MNDYLKFVDTKIRDGVCIDKHFRMACTYFTRVVGRPTVILLTQLLETLRCEKLSSGY